MRCFVVTRLADDAYLSVISLGSEDTRGIDVEALASDGVSLSRASTEVSRSFHGSAHSSCRSSRVPASVRPSCGVVNMLASPSSSPSGAHSKASSASSNCSSMAINRLPLVLIVSVTLQSTLIGPRESRTMGECRTQCRTQCRTAPRGLARSKRQRLDFSRLAASHGVGRHLLTA